MTHAPQSINDLSLPDWTRLYDQTLAAEYRSWCEHWINTTGDDKNWTFDLIEGDNAAPGIVIAGTGEAHINEGLGLGFGDADPAQTMDRVEAAFARVNGRPLIEATPYTDPKLKQEAAHRGFKPRNFLHLFARPMPTKPDALDIPNIRIEPIDKANPEEVERAAQTIAKGRMPANPDGTPSEPDNDTLTINRQIAACPRVATFLAWREQAGDEPGPKTRPVAGSSIGLWDHPLADKHANLFAGSTLPEARGMGLQQALMAARLRWAFDQGCRSASLDCEPRVATERNARRQGFQLIGSKIVLVRDL